MDQRSESPGVVTEVDGSDDTSSSLTSSYLGQVAAGQTAGGVITAIDFGHNTGGLRPLVHHVPAVYSAFHPYTAYYGKREAEAEPYTLAQVAAGQTAGGVITSVGGQPVVPFRSLAGVHHYPYAAPLVYYG